MPTVPYKDPYYLPKNTFKPKLREYYATHTSYKLPEHLKPILKEYLKKPQPRLNPEDYLIVCYRNTTASKESIDLANFIWSITPPRRTQEGLNRVCLVKRPKGISGTYALNLSTKDKLLPVIFEAIEKGIL